MFSQSEIECLKAIDDPRIVRLYQVYNFGGFIYLLMELCKNDLDKIYKHKKMTTPEELFKVVHDTVLAVKACHDRHIAHSDIKPANFLIDQYDRIKISDFGLSSCYENECKCCLFKGTKLFMAPEIFSKTDYDPFSADIWSLGVTIYYIATHHYPFVDKDLDKIPDLIIKGEYQDFRIKDPDLREVVRCCLTKDVSMHCTVNELLELPYFQNQMQQQGLIPLSISRGHLMIVKPMIPKRRSAFGIEQISSLTNFKCMRLHLNKSEAKFDL
ncbi:AGC family protein kinase [Trichomonas vaginalis G3]|uniref:AGC family protein kinase n=1 Tax=Trichomonas vaginalis (strain ATCC PRA-98 / G3) TaxID=412133 RepID=A2GGI1_TRIV3|nr:protein serine/threonine kinase protein [Trichomonas vaginalis G3]EAX83738.1 AGC family protein kinase [Trichomonas vaginalis G3]KAI5549928.1 protein serine/threonine kinase protein [Trichomonas vaginalis G3]|eukprot:XP_001296668.1 AGC family protein kinase [Trichomonas vaginalis G3]